MSDVWFILKKQVLKEGTKPHGISAMHLPFCAIFVNTCSISRDRLEGEEDPTCKFQMGLRSGVFWEIQLQIFLCVKSGRKMLTGSG